MDADVIRAKIICVPVMLLCEWPTCQQSNCRQLGPLQGRSLVDWRVGRP